MDWQNDEFETLLRKFRLREGRPLIVVQPAGIRRYRVRIAAAAALVVAASAFSAILWRRPAKPATGLEEVSQTVAIETPIAVATATTAPPILPVPQEKTPSIKLDPKAPEPLKQLTVVVPAPPQDAGPLSNQDSPQQSGAEESKGHQAFLGICGSCHAVDVVENSHFDTPQEYAAMVDRMIAYGAPASPQQASAIVDYIFRTYGRKSAAAEDRGKAVLNAACGSCHAPDAVESQKDADKETYRSIVNRMIAYGASVAPDQIDPLVEYLFKTYGRRNKN